MGRMGIIAGVLAAGTLMAGAAASRRRSPAEQLITEKPNDAPPRVTDHSVHYEIHQRKAHGYVRVQGTKKEEIDLVDHWGRVSTLYCFGYDGQGGACRVGNDYQRICDLAGGHLDLIDTEEEGRETIRLLMRHIPEDLRLVRVEKITEYLD